LANTGRITLSIKEEEGGVVRRGVLTLGVGGGERGLLLMKDEGKSDSLMLSFEPEGTRGLDEAGGGTRDEETFKLFPKKIIKKIIKVQAKKIRAQEANTHI
jgi:hypothetical protein